MPRARATRPAVRLTARYPTLAAFPPATGEVASSLLALTAIVHALLAHMTASGSIVAVERIYEHARREVANGSDDAGVRAGALEHLETIMDGGWAGHAAT